MPDELKMLVRGPDDPPLGIPGDGGNVLWGYKGSWVGVVYNTIDHKHVVRLVKPGTSVNMMTIWLLIDDELSKGEVPEVVDLVNSTGFLSVVNNLGHLGYGRPLCSTFAERYYGETDTLHLPFGEMTITPNDAKFITGLSIEGKSVKHKEYVQEIDWDKIYKWTKEVFQWDEEKTKQEMLLGKEKQRIFHLSRLRSNFMGTKKLRHEGKEVTRERIIATANVYVLYILGVVIFHDVSGARVNANFIQLLKHLTRYRTTLGALSSLHTL
ncbi:protein MAIN-LIKE 1-like [Papaver somniferum]|uniref:protein MAIN-LIKE 1-like n=1 Tax=Papaver somniferum TaxID=3469 RepID=UPI000E6FF153|nr:protein MAIN-LIKE 1-like [Papaver somniferum]